MRRLLVVATVLSALLFAPQALAKTITIQILKSGFSPASATVARGDMVVWKNADTAQHQVVADDGSFKSPVLNAGQTYSRVFRVTGTFGYHGGVHPSLKGAVKVAAVTLTASRQTVTYGLRVRLSGSISDAKADEQVTVRAKPFNRPARLITVTTDADGNWSLQVVPVIQTTYSASWGTIASNRSIVFVRPRIMLRRLRHGYFNVSVFDVHRLTNNYVWISRWSASAHQYVHLRRVFLKPSKRKVIWTSTFRLRVRHGWNLRAFITAFQAGPGYRYGASNRVNT
jgi:plastocyanin